jgi:hypothetical protein
MDEIREETSAHPYGEEVLVVQPLVGQLDIPYTRHGHVHSPLMTYLLVIEGEITTMLVTPQ